MAHVTTPPATLTDPTQRRFRGSAKIADYQVMQEKLGEGTFGVVSKAQSKRTGAIVALKKILMHNEREGFPITALREVKLLKMLSHPNILRLEEMAVERQPGDEKGKSGKKRATLYMVTPYMDHDLSGMLTNQDINFSIAQIKCYMLQLLEGVRYLHESHILHRDMKAANILISNKGILQIADFGLARHYEGPTPQPGGGSGEATRDYTSLVVTRWYRPPELLLTLKRYTPAIDLWGVGCVFGEMFERKPILEGKTDVDQCVRIFQLVGSPTNQNMPGWSELPGCEGTRTWDFHRGDIDKRFGSKVGPDGLDLLKQLLCLDWRARINAVDALQHKYFNTPPLPARPEDLPRYEDSHELDSRRRGHEKQRALPPAPAGGTVGMGPDEWTGSGPPTGSYQNGYGYSDRMPPRGYGRDRGPPGIPPTRGYDDRRGPTRGPPVEPPIRQPAWRQERDNRAPPLPATNGHALPPRPADLPPRPAEMPPRPSDMPARGPPPPAAGSRGGNADTYIPSYSAADSHARAPPWDYDRNGRRGSREMAYREPVAPRRDPYRDPDAPPTRDRAPYRDADGPPYRERDSYRDNDAPRERPAYRDPDAPATRDRAPYREPEAPSYRERDEYRRDADQRRTRSRSPERGQRESDARRERLQNRERDMYRRQG